MSLKPQTYKNMRTIDRQAIMEEINQNKLDEIISRSNVLGPSNGKAFSRKYSNFKY